MELMSATQVAPNPWRQIARRALVSLAPRQWLLSGGPAHANAVCLTFDDGPHPAGTPAVLDALAQADARATFFLQGAHAAAYPELVRAIHRAGHAVGSHSWSHGRPSDTSAAALAAETRETCALIRTVLDLDTHLFRPPHGKLSVAKFARLVAMKQTTVLWTYDPGDGFQPSAQAITRWFQAHPPRPGDIVLLHDKTPSLAEALPQILALIRERSLGFATIEQWVGHGRRTSFGVSEAR